MKDTNILKENMEFDSHKGLSQSEENKYACEHTI